MHKGTRVIYTSNPIQIHRAELYYNDLILDQIYDEYELSSSTQSKERIYTCGGIR